MTGSTKGRSKLIRVLTSNLPATELESQQIPEIHPPGGTDVGICDSCSSQTISIFGILRNDGLERNSLCGCMLRSRSKRTSRQSAYLRITPPPSRNSPPAIPRFFQQWRGWLSAGSRQVTSGSVCILPAAYRILYTSYSTTHILTFLASLSDCPYILSVPST